MSDQILGIGSRVKHPAFGEGAVVAIDVIAYKVCFMQFGLKNVGKDYKNWEIVEAIELEAAVSFSDAERALVKILRAYNAIDEEVKLGDKWVDGLMILRPGDSSLKDKELPIDTFFHKIVMVRDRLRVMEQRVNASNLNDEEKINLQQYITKIYGSLTTFNVMFRYKEDQFIGEKSGNE